MVDISYQMQFSSMVGFTENEIRANKQIVAYLEAIAETITEEAKEAKKAKKGKETKETKEAKEAKEEYSIDDVIDQLLSFYDGYRYSFDAEEKIINPFSFL